MKKIKKITILGTGNIANQYCGLFLKNNFEIDCVYGNNEKNVAKEILDKSIFTSNISELPNDSDLYIVALSDDVYLEVLKGFKHENKFIVHTSGSLESKTLEIATKRWGCIYPLQTIKKSINIKWEETPFYIEASNSNDENLLKDFCVSNKLNFTICNSSKRKKLHLAAVMSSNFSYHLFSMVKNYCLKNDVNFNDLKPLLENTLENSIRNSPFELQTGPAIRNDYNLINSHLEDLKENQDLKEIYEIFSNQIIKKNKNEL